MLKAVPLSSMTAPLYLATAAAGSFLCSSYSSSAVSLNFASPSAAGGGSAFAASGPAQKHPARPRASTPAHAHPLGICTALLLPGSRSPAQSVGLLRRGAPPQHRLALAGGRRAGGQRPAVGREGDTEGHGAGGQGQ